MKRWQLLPVMALIIMITNTKLNAAQTEVVDVTLTIQTLSVVRVSTPVFSMAGVLGATKVADSIKYKNEGDGTETFQVRVGTDTGGWRLVQTNPGNDEFRLSGIWHHWGVNPSTGEFQTDDILTQVDQTSSDTVFTNPDETHITVNTPRTENVDRTVSLANQRAVNVPVGDVRDFYVKIDFPTSITLGASAKIKLLVTAQAGQ